jgi:2,4'-dihydroxyacetophenone dioxygenase
VGYRLIERSVVSMKVPANTELGKHYHTGIVVAHTISGAWRYKESNWIARAGDTLYESANGWARRTATSR